MKRSGNTKTFWKKMHELENTFKNFTSEIFSLKNAIRNYIIFKLNNM
jgi:hypothetical protein